MRPVSAWPPVMRDASKHGRDAAVEFGNGGKRVVVDGRGPAVGILAPGMAAAAHHDHLADQEARDVDMMRAEVAHGAAAGAVAQVAPRQMPVGLAHVDQELAAVGAARCQRRPSAIIVLASCKAGMNLVHEGAGVVHVRRVRRLPDGERFIGRAPRAAFR